MKKILSFFICLSLLCALPGMITTANAAKMQLPDGGSFSNSGCEFVYGRTSGGVDGYMNIQCEIKIDHGGLFSNDSVIAKIESDVRSGLSVTINTVAWYTTADTSDTVSNNQTSTTIPDTGFSVTATAPNDYVYKGTAGYVLSSTTRGDWMAGTTIMA